MTNSIAIPQEWIDRETVMRRLDKSQATIERLVAAKQIETKHVPMPGRRPMVLYRAEDVDQLLARGKTAALTAAPTKPTTLGLAPELVAILREIVDRVVAPREPHATAKFWLTLDEAAELSGLGKGDLRRLCRQGKLVARKSAGWKIRRESLEGFKG